MSTGNGGPGYLKRSRPVAAGPGLTCVDLFSGAGGLAEGFRQAGFRILSGTDINHAAGETFRSNFPSASFFELPIRDLQPSDLLEDAGLRRGQLDCLIGGPPCQAFSYNNHLRSDRTAQARLFLDYLDIVACLRPKCLVMENVPGILTIGGGAVLEQITDSLEDLGYSCEARILYAEDFGVPQERRRVFFVASRLEDDDRLFPRGSHGPRTKPSEDVSPHVHRWERRRGQPERSFTTVWSAIGDLPVLENGGGTEVARYTKDALTPYQRRMREGRRLLYNHIAPALSKGMLRRVAAVPEGGNWRDIPFRMLPAGMQRALKKDHTKRYGRLRKKGLCCTILTKCDPHWGSYIHPSSDRAISVREAARLQSFPDSFRFFGFKWQQFEQVGNAVPPLMASALGRSVRRHLCKYSD